MITVILDLLDVLYSWGSRGGPRYSTTLVRTDSGAEQAIQKWSQSLGKWDISYSVQTQAQLQALQQFFHARQGKSTGFLFLDPIDNTGTLQALGVGDGTTTTFQLVMNYTSGGITTVRKITKPNVSTVAAFVSGVSTAATVNASTGVLTFGTAPASGHPVTASFQYYVPVRFDSDVNEVTINGLIGGWDRIELVEVLQ